MVKEGEKDSHHSTKLESKNSHKSKMVMPQIILSCLKWNLHHTEKYFLKFSAHVVFKIHCRDILRFQQDSRALYSNIIFLKLLDSFWHEKHKEI